MKTERKHLSPFGAGVAPGRNIDAPRVENIMEFRKFSGFEKPKFAVCILCQKTISFACKKMKMVFSRSCSKFTTSPELNPDFQHFPNVCSSLCAVNG